jgi:hypothetical protein
VTRYLLVIAVGLSNSNPGFTSVVNLKRLQEPRNVYELFLIPHDAAITENDGYFAVLIDKVRQHKISFKLFSIFVPSGLESVGKARRRMRLQVCSSIIVERVAASRTPKEAKP